MKMRDIMSLVEGQIIEEGRDAPLFHFTVDNTFVKKILPEDRLRQGKRGGVSLTRDLHSPFYGDRWTHEVMLILNQRALAQRYKMVPLYGDSLEAVIVAKHADPNDPYAVARDESEERVMSDIAPLHKYLLAIALPFDANLMGGPADLQWVRRVDDDSTLIKMMHVADYCSKFEIPLVARESVRPNGTWTQDCTKVALANGKKIAARFAKEGPRSPAAMFDPLAFIPLN